MKNIIGLEYKRDLYSKLKSDVNLHSSNPVRVQRCSLMIGTNIEITC